ncbi:amino acid ABC transporter permease [Desertibacillus haloalkaliphilus]|uniref:amino acid ABC transporter permease n=1 Tax=Desertibacillus haloalkaliphilus TaxID=1328930 RepID=UPI001C2708EE|nr:amino acid ABC transporter permease [Desertibacillus haloalkaliphilus]MBU8907767.1 amino acid ABC transporter permease [Desertibacillus haloalkaliphilus]
MGMDFSQIVPSIPFILNGIWVTLQIVVISILLGLVLGTLLALLKIARNRFYNFIADAYTSVFRGTPLILQLFIIFYAVPEITGYNIPAYLAAVLAFGLNSSAYVSEIIRAGIQAVDKGQREAAEALGIPYRNMMVKIILPQAMKNILPALVNEFINLTKESAIVTTVGVMDIMRRAYIVGADTFSFLPALLVAGAIYYVIVLVLSLLGKRLERRLKQSD